MTATLPIPLTATPDAPVLRLVVHGTPAPQGSKSFKGLSRAGRAILTESSSKVKPWRTDVKDAAEAAIRCGCPDPGCTALRAGFPLDEPLTVRMIFTLAKPSGAPKRRRTWPMRYPDLSKLARSTEDALSQAGVWKDDARVVGYDRLWKAFPGEDPEALPVPGVLIVIRRVDPAEVSG